MLRSLNERLERPLGEPPAWPGGKVEKGERGAKPGKGLHDWSDNRPKRASDTPEPEAAMADRLFLPIVNTAAACLREGVVEDADLLDASNMQRPRAPRRGRRYRR